MRFPYIQQLRCVLNSFLLEGNAKLASKEGEDIEEEYVCVNGQLVFFKGTLVYIRDEFQQLVNKYTTHILLFFMMLVFQLAHIPDGHLDYCTLCTVI